MIAAPAYVLARYRHWQYFGTYTYEILPSIPKMRSDFFATMRRLARKTGQHFLTLHWCLRIERGSLGRRHMHFLLGNVHGSPVLLSYYLQDSWSQEHGFAQVYRYIRELNGPAYVTKCLTQDDQRLAPQAYEASRFGLIQQELELAHSLVEALARDMFKNRQALSTAQKAQPRKQELCETFTT